MKGVQNESYSEIYVEACSPLQRGLLYLVPGMTLNYPVDTRNLVSV